MLARVTDTATISTWRRRALGAAAVALAVDGVGFGVLVPRGIASVARGDGVPTAFGFPTYGGGPFEDVGIPTTVPLLAGFLAFCVLQVVAAALVGWRRRSGAVLGLVLLPVGCVFWWGFALPLGPPLGVAAAALVVLGWPELGQTPR